MSGFRIEGNVSGNVVEVNSSNQLIVTTETNASANPGNVGNVRAQNENDPGTIVGSAVLASTEVDDDFKQRVSAETLLDLEIFNYAAQNTGKHTQTVTTMAATWSASGYLTNSGSILTAATGLTFGTYAFFPMTGAQTIYCECDAAFTQQPTANVVVDFGLFLRGAATSYAPTDGVYFRMSSAGLQGVINFNGVETATSVFVASYGGSTYTYSNNQMYMYCIAVSGRYVDFWINNVLYARLATPSGNSKPFLSASLPFSIRHAITGSAATAPQFNIQSYTITAGGFFYQRSIGEALNASLGAYQGLSGGTMGGLTVYTNNTNPTAAVPSNTALTANLPGGLGGQAWETLSSGLSLNTDGILMSYQVPAGTVAIQGRRLKVTGVKMSAFIQTAVTGGPFNSTFALAYGHTAVSLATAEAATTKKPRILLLPELTQLVTATQAINTMVTQSTFSSIFDQPVYVNPGEFIAFVVKHIGTIGTVGVIAYNIQYIYSWE